MMGETTIQAWYETSPVPEYAGNPLIEAMPPIWSEADAAERLAEFPPLPNEERNLPKEIRLHCINRLSHLIQPLSIHLELEAAISSVLRGGYVGRNPMEGGMRHLHALAARNSSVLTFNSTASTFSLVGLSGMGKTTALKSVLRHYPQVIKHSRYNGRDFIHTQIVWLKLECPFDGSLNALCQSFFQAVDQALGDDTHARYYRNRRNVADLIPAMGQVAALYFVGALFIDETQHLREAKAAGKKSVLNFFVNLINSIGIPVVFIGTNSMVEIFSDIVRNARRLSGHGIYDFKQPQAHDDSWDLLLTAMWDYQWVQHPVPLTDSLRSTIYDLSQGVTDFLTKLMILGQRYAIQSGVERLDEQVFLHVAATKMKLLQPALAALRSRDPKEMEKFEDLLPVDAQLAQMMLGDVQVTSDRISLLRGKYEKLVSTMANGVRSPTKEPPAPANPNIQLAGLDLTVIPNVEDHTLALSRPPRVAPLSARLESTARVTEVLREVGWVANDPFEFEPAYQVA
jgi:hypothetical protein